MNKTIKRIGLCAILFLGLLSAVKGQALISQFDGKKYRELVFKAHKPMGSGRLGIREAGYSHGYGNQVSIVGLSVPFSISKEEEPPNLKNEACMNEVRMGREMNKIIQDWIRETPARGYANFNMTGVYCVEVSKKTFMCEDLIYEYGRSSLKEQVLKRGFAKKAKADKDGVILFGTQEQKKDWCRIAKEKGY